MGLFTWLFGKPPKRRKPRSGVVRRTTRGLRKVNRTLRWLNKPYHARNAKRGMKY